MSSPLDSRSEAEALRLQSEGDADAFAILYRNFYPRLCKFLTRFTDRHHAEDLAQETLARALKHIEQIEAGRPLWPWLKTVARNLAIDEARKRSREVLGVETPEVPQWEDPLAFEDRRLLSAALARLNAEQSTAILLRYVEEQDMADIAASFGLGPAAFKQFLYRARQKLRAEYQRLLDGPLGALPLILREFPGSFAPLAAAGED